MLNTNGNPGPVREGRKTISRSFLTGLLLIVLIGFIASIGFSWVLQTRLSGENAAELLRINIADVKQDILDASDQNLLTLAHEVADSLTAGLSTPTVQLMELMKRYDVSEIDLIDSDGIIVACTNPEFVGFDMKSGEQSAEFMPLADGTATEIVQSYQPISYDASISRKYGGVSVEGGFIQVGYDAARFQKDVDRAVVGITHNWHVGRGGFVLISDRDRIIVSDPYRSEGQPLETTGLRIDPETMPEDRIFHQTVYGIPCSCLYGFSEGYLIVSVIPENEIVMQRDTSVILSSALMILIFIALFVMIFLLVRKLVVRNSNRVNDSLSRITEGNLDEVVDVRSNSEFSSLSDDINATVSTLKQYIAAAASRIDQELAFAKNIQHSALPSVFPPYPDRKDFSLYATMNPAREVGGDFYDFYLLDENRLGFLIADVSGKGIPAAMFMMMSRTLIKNHLMSGCDPASALERINLQLCERNKSQMFVTVWLAVLNVSTGKGLACNAGHEHPALRRSGGDFGLVKYKHGMLVGVSPKARYQNREFQLRPGASVFVYTDGVPEATAGSKEMFGEERLAAALNACPGAGPEEVLRRVKSAVDDFVGDAEQFDDLTMLCLEYKGPAACGGDADR